ncbi:uncharacterized protein LOC130724829 [Lotus japonicus]|uniref:uncharacterized protein LOC130724829 n=1 Tax=Lotus japonicus TaxID=34305 RepID=UPI00258E5726|nr:uncharacterized protein LOC130724829 [Lotus japonicus]
MVERCELLDLGAIGSKYTWFRRTDLGQSTSKRLDRALDDVEWRHLFPEAVIENLPRIHSDHCPLLLRCGGFDDTRGKRPFRFLAAWASHPLFQEVIENGWNQGDGRILSRLEHVQQRATDFNKNIFGNIFQRKRTCENRLKGVQRAIEEGETSSLLRLEKDLQQEYGTILYQEELLWYQKSREQWVRFGDRNTRFFHAQTVIRRKRNKIHGLVLPDGTWSTEQVKLVDAAQSFFQGQFASPAISDPEAINLQSLPRLRMEGVEALLEPVTKEEVRLAAFDQGILDSLVVLIPKVDFPKHLKEFRPISLCTVIYKIITKVLVGRIRPYLGDLIGPLQGSFIPGRSSADNILLAQEAIHYMKKTKLKKGALAMKSDLEKAYDNISWEFLKRTLEQFGFSSATVKLIMWIATNSKLSILWNGTRLDSFAPSRGLRQGDPMSPYLFLLCMEILSLHIHELVQQGLWKPIHLARNSTRLSHLLFAYDIVLFAHASSTQVQVAWLPTSVCDRMDQINRKFIWSSNPSKKGWHLVKWGTVTNVKSQGGLGVREARMGNIALLGKLVWKMLHEPSCLWVQQFKSIYLKETNFFDYKIKGNVSFAWRSIIRARDVLKHGFSFLLQHGDSSLWYNDWAGIGALCHYVPYVHISDVELKLKDIWNTGWQWNKLWTIIPQKILDHLNQIAGPTGVPFPDAWRWQHRPDGLYTVASCYSWLRDQSHEGSDQRVWSRIWKLQIPEKYKFFLWLCLHNARRFTCQLASSPACTRCSHPLEDGLHCLRDCPHSKEIWLRSGCAFYTLSLKQTFGSG